MKNDCVGLSYKNCLLSGLILLLTFGSIVPYSYGEEEEKKTRWGFSIFGGTGDATYSKVDTEVYGFLPRVSFPLRKDWTKWDLEFEGNFFYYDIHKMHDFYFLGISHNIVFKPVQEKWGSLFLLAGGGLGYDSAGDKLKRGPSEDPIMGDQHFAGFCHGGAGVSFNMSRGTALRMEYRFYHISEPFYTKDRGLNTHNFLLGITFR